MLSYKSAEYRRGHAERLGVWPRWAAKCFKASGLAQCKHALAMFPCNFIRADTGATGGIMGMTVPSVILAAASR